ncbi:2-amino-4-hydroxy-6-hydroxymethyldihydropteridine pyrophosphokinase [gamma proteobacterium HTCC5015]|nr:2-amino-4-hydroxy-6-hydroxymethyldihydropteridine pyrophosphokinase [gamma proteobacterium HTCC5015]
MKQRAFVSIGSNQNAARQIATALRRLEQTFGALQVSTVYQNPAVGFEGDDFLNLVVGFDSELGVEGTARVLRDIEAEQGRDRSQPKFSSRVIDLDLLLYGDETGDFNGVVLPRDEILKYAFVLCPLAELIGERVHPIAGRSYRELWREFGANQQGMTPVSLQW